MDPTTASPRPTTAGKVSVSFEAPRNLALEFDATCERLKLERDQVYQELMAAFVTRLNQKLAYLFPQG